MLKSTPWLLVQNILRSKSFSYPCYHIVSLWFIVLFIVYSIPHSFILLGTNMGNTVATPRPHGKWQAYCKLKSPASQDSLCRQWLCHKPATGQGRIETTARCRLPPFCLDWSRQIEINFQSNCSPGLIFKQVIRAGGSLGPAGGLGWYKVITWHW